MEGRLEKLLEFKNMKVLLPTPLATEKLRTAVRESGAKLTTEAFLDYSSSVVTSSRISNNNNYVGLLHVVICFSEAAGQYRCPVRSLEAQHHCSVSGILEGGVTCFH